MKQGINRADGDALSASQSVAQWSCKQGRDPKRKDQTCLSKFDLVQPASCNVVLIQCYKNMPSCEVFSNACDDVHVKISLTHPFHPQTMFPASYFQHKCCLVNSSCKGRIRMPGYTSVNTPSQWLTIFWAKQDNTHSQPRLKILQHSRTLLS